MPKPIILDFRAMSPDLQRRLISVMRKAGYDPKGANVVIKANHGIDGYVEVTYNFDDYEESDAEVC